MMNRLATIILSLALLSGGMFLISAPSSAQVLDPQSLEFLRQVLSATPDPQAGKPAYIRNCAACHGTQGLPSSRRDVPHLFGQHEYYLLFELVQIKALNRLAPEMHHVLANESIANAQSIRDLSAYIASQPTLGDVEHGSGQGLASGEQLYQSQCAQCHGKNGEGDDAMPRLAGQNYTYLLTQLRLYTAGHRNNTDRPTLNFVAGLSTADQTAVADYLSRLMAQKSSRQ